MLIKCEVCDGEGYITEGESDFTPDRRYSFGQQKKRCAPCDGTGEIEYEAKDGIKMVENNNYYNG
jgi:hypothetical protein